MAWSKAGSEAGEAVETTPAYAEIHAHDASTPESIANGAAYSKVVAFTDDGFSANCTPDAANGKITVTRNGRYSVDSSLSFSSGTNNVVFNAGVFVDGVEAENVHFQRKVSASGDVGSASATGFIEITGAPVDVDIRINQDQGVPVDVTVTYINLNILYIGAS